MLQTGGTTAQAQQEQIALYCLFAQSAFQIWIGETADQPVSQSTISPVGHGNIQPGGASQFGSELPDKTRVHQAAPMQLRECLQQRDFILSSAEFGMVQIGFSDPPSSIAHPPGQCPSVMVARLIISISVPKLNESAVDLFVSYSVKPASPTKSPRKLR